MLVWISYLLSSKLERKMGKNKSVGFHKPGLKKAE
jgi:hypothetical protein